MHTFIRYDAVYVDSLIIVDVCFSQLGVLNFYSTLFHK